MLTKFKSLVCESVSLLNSKKVYLFLFFVFAFFFPLGRKALLLSQTEALDLLRAC